MSTINPIFQNQKAQKVEVVNEVKASLDNSSANPLAVIFPSKFLVDYNTAGSIRVSDRGASSWIYSRPSTGNFNVMVSALYVQDFQTGFVTVVPLNQVYYNLTTAQISSLEASFHAFNALYPATSPAKVIYSTISSSATISQVVYTLQ